MKWAINEPRFDQLDDYQQQAAFEHLNRVFYHIVHNLAVRIQPEC